MGSHHEVTQEQEIPMRLQNRVGSMVAVVLLACPVGAVAGPKYKGFARGEALITVEELKHLLDARDPKLIVLAVVEPASYKMGHIPTSLNVWRPDYEHKVGQPYPFEGMLLDREGFQRFARDLGIDNDSKLVVYDEKYDATSLWWAFHLYGKTDTRVLDGGYPAWNAVFPGPAPAPARGRGEKTGNFVARQRRSGWRAGMEDVRRAEARPRVRVWDTREPEEWSGTEKKGGARRAGRVPWAAFQSWKEYRVEVGGKPTGFKSAPEIRQVIERFKMDPRDEQIFYCHSGVRSTTAIFALWLLGWDPDRLYNYEGSWLEWSYHESNPVLTGP
jgi:thiosulfate/3-mercaptopyruvate sulfurtransferase